MSPYDVQFIQRFEKEYISGQAPVFYTLVRTAPPDEYSAFGIFQKPLFIEPTNQPL